MAIDGCTDEEVWEFFLHNKGGENIELPFDVDYIDSDSNNVLMIATLCWNLKWVNLLLKSDFNPNTKDNDGNNALIALAINKDDNVIYPYSEKDIYINIRMIDLLLTHGLDINSQNNNGTTALIGYVGLGEPTIIKYLLNKGSNKNLRDKKGMTALDYLLQLKEYLDNFREIFKLLA